MILLHQLQQPSQQIIAFLLRHTIDMADVRAHGKHALPARDGIRAHHGMHGAELGADVLRRPARLVVQRKAGALGNLGKVGLGEGGGERFEKLLVRRAEAVVDVVARSPECVYVLKLVII